MPKEVKGEFEAGDCKKGLCIGGGTASRKESQVSFRVRGWRDGAGWAVDKKPTDY